MSGTPLFENELEEPLRRLFGAIEVAPHADTAVPCVGEPTRAGIPRPAR